MTATDDSRHRCPDCGTVTRYAAYSGGREYYCPTCDDNGFYPASGPGLPRATMLRTPEGREQLKHDMAAEARRLNQADGV